MKKNGTEMETNVVPTHKTQEKPMFTKTIGKTTYRVMLHFSKTSKETITDKIKRLIENDILSS